MAVFPPQQCPAGKTSDHAMPSPKKDAGGSSFLSVSQMNPDYVTKRWSSLNLFSGFYLHNKKYWPK